MSPCFEHKGTTLYQGDCLEVMRVIPDGSVDACITDPPYGTTACSWDSVIPFAPMWAELKRIVKRNGAIVLFGSQPFTSALVMSSPQMFKHEWVWEKDKAANVLNAGREPLKVAESVLVFGVDLTSYNPIKAPCKPYKHKNRSVLSANFGRNANTYNPEGYTDYVDAFPRNVLYFAKDYDVLHPTQKPADLLRYLVRTYTNEGDAVLDFTCGSGTTGVACVIEHRNFIGIEQDAHYCEVSAARIKRAQGIACDIPKRTKQYAPTPLFEAVA